MQNQSRQLLFQFPDNEQVDLEQLYNRILAYIAANNQNQLLSQQISQLQTTIQNNKQSSDQSFKDVNGQILTVVVSLSQLQANQQNYLLITPTDKINLNSNYLIDISQINNLNNLQIKLRQINDLNQLMIKSNQISDISLNALKSDIQQTDLTNYYNKQQVDQKISSIKIDPVDLSNYLKITDYSIQIVDYLKIQDFNDQIKKYLTKSIDQTTLLKPNYNIIVSQIKDLNDYMGSNYYNKQQVDQQIKYIQINPIDLSNYYNKQQVDQQIQNNKQNIDLSKYLQLQDYNAQIQNYLLINDYTNDKNQSTYQLQQYCKQNYLSINIDRVTLLNQNYNIFTSQIQDLQSYMNSYALQSNLDQIINNKLQQYLLINPSNNTFLHINYKILKEQITNLDTVDLSNYYNKQQVDQQILINKQNIDLSNYFLISDFNFQIQNYLLINDYVNDKKNFINQDYLQQYCKQNYLSINIDKVTLLNQNYNILTSQIQDQKTYMNNFTLQSNLDQIINNKLQQYLLINPSNNTFLNINYKIVKEQISNLDTIVLINYYNKQQVDQLISQIQVNPVDLINYYNKQQVDQKLSQIQINPVDLSKYLLIDDYDNQIKDYLLAQEYYLDRKRFITIDYVQYLYDQYYLAKFVDQITLLNPNYNIIVSQIQDLNNYMGNYYNKQQVDQQIQNNKQIVDLSNYYNKQQVDQQIQNNKQIVDLSNYYNKQQVDQQIQNNKPDLQKYVLTNDLTKQLQNYVLLSNLTQNYYTQQQINDQFINFLRVDDYNFFQQDYVKKYDYNQFVKNCLVVVPSNPIQLNQNYSISCFQISDLYTNYYNRQEINGLLKQFNDYLRIIPSPQTQLNQNYQISTNQITNFYQILSNYVLQNDLLNSLSQYLLTSPTVVLPLNTNYTIISSQIVDFNTQLQNYLLINPSLKTALNTNYTIKQSQITDLSPTDMSNYLLINPSSSITLNSKYSISGSQITNRTINNLQIAANTITNSEIAQNTIQLQNLYQDLVNLIQKQKIYVKYNADNGRILQVDQTGSVCQYGQQLTFSNGSQTGTAYCYTGFGGYMFTGNSNVNNVNWQQSPSSYIQLDTTKKLNVLGCYGMHFNNVYYNQPSFIGFCGLQPWIIGGNYNCCFFSMNTSPSVYAAYISSDGTYFRNSDENKKQNIQNKQNYQDQLNKILKLDIVTYSYDLNYTEKIQELQQSLKDENLTEERKKSIQNDIFQIQVYQSQVQQGFTYQNLQDCGFNYVLNNKQVMNNQFLDQKGFDKDKIKKEIANNQELTISESNFIPYLIMGIKALNEKIEQQSQRLDIIDQAMMKTHQIINEVSSQTDQKIQDVQQNSILNSINSDSIDDIKNTLNKFIYQFEASQKTVKKFQKQIAFLNSQIEHQQQIIDKQQQDIINIKLKTKIV